MTPLLPSDLTARAQERFWTKVFIGLPDECWPWQGHIGHRGYGMFSLKIGTRWTAVYCHRVSLALSGVHLTEGVVDHTCHNKDVSCKAGDSCQHRRCVNPAHLELVSSKENSGRAYSWSRRKFCLSGRHEVTAENTYFRTNGTRHCRLCNQIARNKEK